MLFKELNLSEGILRSLEQEGYKQATPIQEKAIPVVLEGKDLLGCAQTGTGKTAAFAIPIIQLLDSNPAGRKPLHIRCLILTPTRELAIQIDESIDAYGRNNHLKHTVIFGGVNQNRQVTTLGRGVDILVATPGRLLDLMQQGYISLKGIEIFVLDEADRMLDMGFIHDVKKVIAALPAKRQTLFFSATMPPEISKLADSILHKPVRVEVSPVSSTAETIKQKLFYVDRTNKNALLLHLLENSAIRSALVFTRTKHGADKIAKLLNRSGIKAQAIHGNKAQNARQNALNSFRNGETRVLVATDIAARGIDIDELEYVINFDIPNIAETYVHRIGRTGRAGNRGTAFSLCDAEEKAYIRGIEKLTQVKIPVVDEHPFPMAQGEVKNAGPVAEVQKKPQQGARRNHSGYQGRRRAR